MPPASNPHVGSAIRARRKQLGLTLRGLAETAQIDKGFLSRVETNQSVPGTSTLMALAAALETTIGELAGEEPQAAELPELHFYLRAKYDLSDDAIARVATYLHNEYGGEPGPLDGEDEVDDIND